MPDNGNILETEVLKQLALYIAEWRVQYWTGTPARPAYARRQAGDSCQVAPRVCGCRRQFSVRSSVLASFQQVSAALMFSGCCRQCHSHQPPTARGLAGNNTRSPLLSIDAVWGTAGRRFACSLIKPERTGTTLAVDVV